MRQFGSVLLIIVGGLLALLGGGCAVAGIVAALRDHRGDAPSLIFSGVALAVGLGVLAGGYRLMRRSGDGGGPQA